MTIALTTLLNTITVSGHEFTYPIDPLVTDIRPSDTLKANNIKNKRKELGLPVTDFGLGANPLKVPQVILNAVRENADKKFYGTTNGIKELSQIIAQRYSSHNYKILPENVLVAPGLKQLLFDVQRAFGGPIIHVVPHWVSYSEQTHILGKKPIQVYTKFQNQFKLQPEEIDMALEGLARDQAKLIIFNHPVNPTGMAYTNDELEKLAQVFRKHNIVVFADEVYLGNHFQNHRHSISEFLPERTIRATSLSKEFALGGYRLGWATFPEELQKLKEVMSAIGTSSYTCAPIPMQYAALAALTPSKEMDEFVGESQLIFKVLGKLLFQKFTEIGLQTNSPDAAWYFLLDFESYRSILTERGITTSFDLVERILHDLGIVFVPGGSFGLDPEKLMVRASFIDFDADAAVTWVKQGAKSEELSWANHLLLSLDQLSKWLQK